MVVVILSISVVGNEIGLGGARSSLILAKSSQSVGLGSLEKGGLSSGHVLLLALPGLKHGGLESSSVGEGESPRLGDALELVHGVQVEGSIFLRLSS